MFTHPKFYDVIIVGAGHAGIEAALAASRMGCRTLLLTMNLDTMGKMSCNPSIGGLAKGQIVREIDALGGQMGITTDLVGIQFRLLNRKKGPAVRAPRAQCDKKAYQLAMKAACEYQSHLDLRQAQVVALVTRNHNVLGVETSMDLRFLGTCVILTTGTFLHGLMHIGEIQHPGGRDGEQASYALGDNLIQLGFELQRLKTGTPPRLNRHTVDWSRMQEQPGDFPPPPFSFLHESSYWETRNEALPHSPLGVTEPQPALMEDQNKEGAHGDFPNLNAKSLCTGALFHVEQRHDPTSFSSAMPSLSSPWHPPLRQVPCHITHTTHRTAQIIRANLHRSPIYSGQIRSVGPRYCPSIEDKYVKFPDKEIHQVFLEPEGIHTDEIYVNGCSTSLPYEIQMEVVHSIQGLEQAVIMRAGYAVEYDFAPPTQLYPWLETKRFQNLFFAGQINGTTGYEEAAAQRLVAGVNAALRIQQKPSYIFPRFQSYIGVLVDDLVTKGTQEPYRMFTSRAEYRLLLRQDNADERLTHLGYGWGLISAERMKFFKTKQARLAQLKETLRTRCWQGIPLEQWLRRPEINMDWLTSKLGPLFAGIPGDLGATVEMDIKYEGYIMREAAHVGRLKKTEEQRIPENINYQEIRALRRETRDKLQVIRPQTIGQAGRISGVTPADIGVLLVWLKKQTIIGDTSPNLKNQMS